jgi:hypothetical protein
MEKRRQLNVQNNNKLVFWKKESGNMMSSGKGLSKEELEFLQSLKEGDRLIVWDNAKSKKGESSPDFTLKKYTMPAKSNKEFLG